MKQNDINSLQYIIGIYTMRTESEIYLACFSVSSVTKAEKTQNQVLCLTWIDWEVCPEILYPCVFLP